MAFSSALTAFKMARFVKWPLVTRLLEEPHLQAIGFIHQNESGRIIPAADLSERWFKGRQLFGKPIVIAEKRVPVLDVALLYLLEGTDALALCIDILNRLILQRCSFKAVRKYFEA